MIAKPFLFLLCLVCLAFAAPAMAVDFNFDIRPLLSDRCYVCHGPDAENRQADLRLDLAEGFTKEAESGDAPNVVTPGDLDQSELWLRISSDDPDLVMPPPDSNLTMSKAEIQKLGEWIKAGAEYKQHWSFLPLQSNEFSGEAKSAIDHYIDRKLAEHGLPQSHEGSREQLIRRLYFDLTGLPPTVEDVREFLSTKSATAYEDLVDRLLDSEEYGERMAAVWLDIARYSDTYGYQVDRDRFVWPYRDWVIEAFNRNLPYDQFVTEQLAGDLLPQATEKQILATTFNRLHPQKVEGGSVPEEFRIEYVADRTQTFATAMLGLTLECARCHDHKYDPLSQREYYELTAFFDKIDEAGLYSYFTPSIPTPTLLMDKDGAKAKLADLRARVEEEEKELRSLAKSLGSAETEISSPVEIPKALEALDFESFKPNGRNKLADGVVGKAVRLSGDDGINLKQGNFHRYEPFSVSWWMNVPEHRERTVVFHRSKAWTDAGSRGYQLLLEDGELSASLIHFWPGNAIRVRSNAKFPLAEWHHVVMTYDGSSRAAGLSLYLDGESLPVRTTRDRLYKHITGGGNDHITIGQRFRDIGFKNGLVDEFQVFDRQLTGAEVRLLFDADDAKSISASELRHHHILSSEAYQSQLATLQQARKAECEALDKLQEIMVMKEMDFPRETYFLGRGAYDNRKEKVTAQTPRVFPEMDPTLPRNRLGLARWLTDPEHPLTARVAVNRFWQLMFGQGLVRTPEDFGSQGQLPTHPDLLDWLARDFIDHGWDVKRLIKQLVMSRTYRQSSVASPDVLEIDPENELYARAPSYRWPAEMLRDQALSVSNLLVSKIGGPPAKPYELEVSFKPMKPDDGEGLYRRSVYTFWKRTGPAPAMMALDAAKRDVCRVKRSRTSSPLQTLVLMNGPQFVEASRALAERVLSEEGEIDAQLELLFVTLTSRHPTSEEHEILRDLYQDQYKRFDTDSKAAETYLRVGKYRTKSSFEPKNLAAMAAVANALFGLDECMMKR